MSMEKIPVKSAETGHVTAEQLLAMGDGRRELIRGEVIEMSPAGARHGSVAITIARHLTNFVIEHGLGQVYAAETGFVLETDPDTVRAPDVAFVRTERVVDTDKYFPGAPDLAVEVRSPKESDAEVSEKVEMWLACGARQAWVLDPRQKTVQVFRPGASPETLTESDAVGGGEVLPRFRLAVRECFPASR